MKKVIFVGAGQMGRMALALCNPVHVRVVGFADNQSSLHGTRIEGLPVMPLRAAVDLKPDSILIAVAGQGRTDILIAQLRQLGYDGEIRALCDYARDLDIRGAVLERLRDRIREIPGALAELGVYQGEFAARMNRLFPERTLYLFDTFEGFDARDVSCEQQNGFSRAARGEFSDTSEEVVLSKMASPRGVVIRKGYFPKTAEGIETRFALVSLDADLYEPTLAGLRYFYPRMNRGGVMLLHDYHNQRFSGVKAAVDAFENESGRLLLLPVADLHGTVMIIKA